MKKKIYVCHANECTYNKRGSCKYDSDVVTIGTYNGGPAICPNFTVDEINVLKERPGSNTR